MTAIQKLLARLNGTEEKEYGARVNRLLRTRYSLSEELAVLRRKEESPEAFAEYFAFAEACKEQAKAELFPDEQGV